ncbi:MAG TPA: type I phosphomannose isomerase catalytic subunit [Acidobacteriaceae bacterium]|nr:type I phosphomannose isomerase catalytic subunit [Acidobacteriaceae bacterium]
MIEPKLQPFRLGIFFSERVWGRHDLAPWYKHPVTEPVGEAWLTGEQCKVETGPYVGKSLAEMRKDFGADLLGDLDEFPLLVKILFPEDKLSVQVHPDDAHAAQLGGNARGKTECWYVLEAAPGATLSLGVKPGTTREMVREALGKESFEALLHEVPVQAGDMIFVEAGTIHAIGPGLVILEVQQMSDSTFRLYDYGRPRELHLEEGMKAVKIENASGKISSRRGHPCSELIHVKYFAVDRCDVAAGESHSVRGEGRPECVVGLSGKGVLTHGDTRLDLPVGYAIVIPACCGGYTVEGECGFVRARVPVEAG